ncbi:MAG: hypothetical protein ABFS45_21580 [Pseudomonadota bacterium]
MNGKIADFSKNGNFANSTIFRDFDGDESKRQIYTVWNFPEATNEVAAFRECPG